MLDTMLTSLAEVLSEKGVITQADWEAKIKKKQPQPNQFQRPRVIQIILGYCSNRFT